MREIGMLLTCNKCGWEEFLLRTEVRPIRDGVDVNVYEDIPKGWTVYNSNDLCPTCTAKLKKVLEDNKHHT